MNYISKLAFAQSDPEKLGQHGWFLHTTEWGLVLTHINHTKFPPLIATKCGTKRSKKQNFLIWGEIMVTGQRRPLALSIQAITLKLFKDKRLKWARVLYWII